MIISPIQDLIAEEGYSTPTKVLSKGKNYFVFAVQKNRRGTLYYILDDQHQDFPLAYDAILFHIVSSNTPTTWLTKKSGWGPFKTVFSSFPAWVNDMGSPGHPGFYERLVDARFDAPEQKMLAEFTEELETTS